ncbi:uncharacterized protein [Prorops nasuta]|uniref:uncharacterized protein n=1 Tax=Prorops nasuta TaxID=863751 RepID=UPI0034CE265D
MSDYSKREIIPLVHSLTCEIISSDESSDSDIETYLLQNLREERVPRAHIKNYLEEVVWEYTDEEFKSHFRLCRQTFRILLELLTPRLTNLDTSPGRPTIFPEKTLLVALWLMATPNSFTQRFFFSPHMTSCKLL